MWKLFNTSCHCCFCHHGRNWSIIRSHVCSLKDHTCDYFLNTSTKSEFSVKTKIWMFGRFRSKCCLLVNPVYGQGSRKFSVRHFPSGNQLLVPCQRQQQICHSEPRHSDCFLAGWRKQELPQKHWWQDGLTDSVMQFLISSRCKAF